MARPGRYRSPPCLYHDSVDSQDDKALSLSRLSYVCPF